MKTRVSTTKLMLTGALALGFQLGATTSQAAPCAGFSDVDDTNPNHTPFCSSVEWIKNRGVTLGCTTTTYCPDASVTRLQMAAFMRRLGDALSPAVITLEANPGPIDLDALPTPRICTTADLDPAPTPPALPGKPYPRRAFISTTFTGQANGALQYRTDLQYSTDNGASWEFVWQNYLNRDGTAGAHWVSSSSNGTVDLEPNLDYRFSVLISREAGAGTGDFAASRCFVNVSVFSRTGTASPFDVNRTKAPDADH